MMNAKVFNIGQNQGEADGSYCMQRTGLSCRGSEHVADIRGDSSPALINLGAHPKSATCPSAPSCFYHPPIQEYYPP